MHGKRYQKVGQFEIELNKIGVQVDKDDNINSANFHTFQLLAAENIRKDVNTYVDAYHPTLGDVTSDSESVWKPKANEEL